jgi:hypothetical protein
LPFSSLVRFEDISPGEGSMGKERYPLSLKDRLFQGVMKDCWPGIPPECLLVLDGLGIK